MRLELLLSRLKREAGHLVVEFRHSCPFEAISCELTRPPMRAHCVIRLFDSWSRFCRSLVVTSAGARPVTAAAGRLPLAPGINSLTDVVPALRAHNPKRPPWWEPRWGRASECIAAAKSLGIPNVATVSAAIGATPSPADDIRALRNFYAHRGEPALAPARAVAARLGIVGRVHPDVIPAYPTLGGMPLYERWVFDLFAIAEAAIQ